MRSVFSRSLITLSRVAIFAAILAGSGNTLKAAWTNAGLSFSSVLKDNNELVLIWKNIGSQPFIVPVGGFFNKVPSPYVSLTLLSEDGNKQIVHYAPENQGAEGRLDAWLLVLAPGSEFRYAITLKDLVLIMQGARFKHLSEISDQFWKLEMTYEGRDLGHGATSTYLCREFNGIPYWNGKTVSVVQHQKQ